MEAIEKACSVVGSQKALSDALSVTPSVISQWIKGVRPVPTERCIEIEKATKGIVRCESIRPDVDWAYLRRCRKARK